MQHKFKVPLSCVPPASRTTAAEHGSPNVFLHASYDEYDIKIIYMATDR